MDEPLGPESWLILIIWNIRSRSAWWRPTRLYRTEDPSIRPWYAPKPIDAYELYTDFSSVGYLHVLVDLDLRVRQYKPSGVVALKPPSALDVAEDCCAGIRDERARRELACCSTTWTDDSRYRRGGRRRTRHRPYEVGPHVAVARKCRDCAEIAGERSFCAHLGTCRLSFMRLLGRDPQGQIYLSADRSRAARSLSFE